MRLSPIGPAALAAILSSAPSSAQNLNQEYGPAWTCSYIDPYYDSNQRAALESLKSACEVCERQGQEFFKTSPSDGYCVDRETRSSDTETITIEQCSDNNTAFYAESYDDCEFVTSATCSAYTGGCESYDAQVEVCAAEEAHGLPKTVIFLPGWGWGCGLPRGYTFTRGSKSAAVAPSEIPDSPSSIPPQKLPEAPEPVPNPWPKSRIDNPDNPWAKTQIVNPWANNPLGQAGTGLAGLWEQRPADSGTECFGSTSSTESSTANRVRMQCRVTLVTGVHAGGAIYPPFYQQLSGKLWDEVRPYWETGRVMHFTREACRAASNEFWARQLAMNDAMSEAKDAFGIVDRTIRREITAELGLREPDDYVVCTNLGTGLSVRLPPESPPTFVSSWKTDRPLVLTEPQ